MFGHIEGFPKGTEFVNRIKLSEAGVHRPRQAGISGATSNGADSIVVSGGYPDDQDFGDWIIYTGHGGNDPGSKRQVADQTFDRGNRALAVTCDRGLPVRVIRGAKGDQAYSPATGYRYDGLYEVERYWPSVGVDGFRVFLYRLRELPDQVVQLRSPPSGSTTPSRSSREISRIDRDRSVTDTVKKWHGFRCQICRTRLDLPSGAYAEGAHVRPLGTPHDGPDTVDNVLCLCPNCHIQFDRLALFIDDEYQVWDAVAETVIGNLRTVPRHALDLNHLEYHRSLRITEG